MAPQKKNLMEHYDDGTLDLSLSGLQEVPVKDIAAIPKAVNLDLSCNTITTLPKSFASSLTRLVKLELSKNQLTALPENFGLLVNLRHLDLDNNKLVSLPLSFGNLKSLRWLDLKQNPLMPKLAEIAGQCLDAKQCQAAAKNVVAALREMQLQVDAEISRRKEEQQKKLDEEEEISKIQNKENQHAKKKKKKTAKPEANKQANGKTHSDKFEDVKSKLEEKLFKETVVPEKKSTQNPGFLRKVGRILNTFMKVIVMSTLLVVFCGFLLSLFDEDLYLSVKKKVSNFIQSNVPKPYLKQWDRGVAATSKAALRWSEQIVTLSVDWYGKVHQYFVTLSGNENVQQFLESIKSGWHILWIQICETANELPNYYIRLKSYFSESSNTSEKPN